MHDCVHPTSTLRLRSMVAVFCDKAWLVHTPQIRRARTRDICHLWSTNLLATGNDRHPMICSPVKALPHVLPSIIVENMAIRSQCWITRIRKKTGRDLGKPRLVENRPSIICVKSNLESCAQLQVTNCTTVCIHPALVTIEIRGNWCS